MSRYAAVSLLLFPLALSAAAPRLETRKDDKPECTAQTRGKLWPEKAGRGAATPVEICAPHGWHYRWEQLTVDVSQLKEAAVNAVVVKEKEVVNSMPATVIAGKRGAVR